MFAIYTPAHNVKDEVQTTKGTKVFAKSVEGVWFELEDVMEIDRGISPDSILSATITCPVSVFKEDQLKEKDIVYMNRLK